MKRETIQGPAVDEKLARAIAALNEIGIETLLVEGATGFLKGIRIVTGTLHVAPECDVGDVLHEAGHLALAPRRYRARANLDMDGLIKEMLADVDRLDLHPDSPLYRAVIQCSDPEATAWAWAFGLHIGLAPEDIIKDHHYPDEDGVGTGAEERLALAAHSHRGIHGLAHAGFCSVNRFGRLPVYPKMAFWTQEL